MSEKLEKAQDIFLDNINQVCREFGLNNIMAQLYAILYFSNKPLSLDDMVKRLKISKGSVSINIRALQRYGVVRRVWFKGSRKDYYEAEADITAVIVDRVKSMAQRRLSGINNMINTAYDAINSIDSQAGEDKEAIIAFKQRLDRLRDFQSKVQSLFNLFNSNLLSTVLKIKTKSGKNSKREAEYASIGKDL